VLLALGFWLACDWKTSALGVLAPIFLACWLGDRFPWKVRRERQALVAAAPILLAAVGAAILGLSLGKAGCEDPPFWPLALPLLGLAASVVFRPCWIRALLVALWLLALGLHCAAQHRDCGPATAPTRASAASAPASAVPSADQTEGQGLAAAAAGKVRELWSGFIDRLRKLLYFDSTAEALSQASEQLGENRLLSIEQALLRPELLSDCKTAIYFPNASMFELNSATINRDVESQLMKLERLREKLPGRELRITGHADKVGADSPQGILRNVELSEQRAAAVAMWLTERTGWKLEDLEAVGAGSKFPLIDKGGDIPLNRRVEIRLRCKPGSTK
jgi:outer membrane protein OmpA-like peptidoglycan-associated protein